MKKVKGQFSARLFMYSLVFSLLLFGFSLIGLRAINFNIPGSLSSGSPVDTVIAVMFLAAIFAFSLGFVYFVFSRLPRFIAFASRFDPLKKLTLSLNAGDKSIYLCWIVIFICWLPWLILAFPADMNGDTLNQLWQYSTGAPTWYTTLGITLDGGFIDHHPVFDTMLFGLFLDFGRQVGSQNIGIFTFVVLQAALGSWALALSCCYLEKLGVPKAIRLGAFIFVALFPPFGQYAATMLKDSLFSIVFLFFFLCVVELYRTKGLAVKKPSFFVAFLLSVVLCVLTKKTGIFIVGVTVVVLLIAYRKNWKYLLPVAATPFLVSAVVLPLLVFPLLNVSAGGKQETFSPLFQQTAAFFINHPDEVTPDEYAIVDKMLKPEKFESKYDDLIVDPIKNTFDYNADTQSIVDYLGVWVSQGLRHPFTYLEATLKVSSRIIAPIMPITYYGSLEYSESFYNSLLKNQGDAGIDIYKPEPIKTLGTNFKDMYEKVLKKCPPLTFLISRGLWGFWVPLFCLMVSFFYRKKSLVVFTPIIISLLFLVITPASSSRYVIPLLFVAPLLIGLMIMSLKTKIKEPLEEKKEDEVDESQKLPTT